MFTFLRALARLILTCRVLRYDDKVLRVNELIADVTGWPEDPKLHPHPFAKLLRHCVSELSYLKRTSKEAIAPMYFWVKRHILLSLSKFVKGVFKLTLTALRGVKSTFCTLLRHLKHLHFIKWNTILRDPEVGDNHTSGGSDDAVFLEEVSEVDRTVDKFISSLDKTFSEQFLQPWVRTETSQWRNGRYACSFLPGTSPLIKYG